jgi:glycosyltransferase involved in cell wall biosynthesis
MRLAVISHKICWKSQESPTGYVTDGGFPLQIEAISELFNETHLVVPCEKKSPKYGLSALLGNRLKIVDLSVPHGEGLRRKINLLMWCLKNGRIIWREIRAADAVHTPIPGDVGTIGMLFALMLRKPLFVRHCGNWMVQRTTAECFWRWSMEKFAGGRNVMFATGGAAESPSKLNNNIKWIFSTSLRKNDFVNVVSKKFPANGKLKLVIACRQENNKGTSIVIKSLPLILQNYQNISLDIIGDGSLIPKLKEQVKKLKLDDIVFFHGKVEQKEVVKIMKKADIFCYPTSASEGFPKVVLEALACGLPVITTKVSVLPELIKKDCGILINENSPEALAEAVIKLANDKNYFEKLSENAIKKASDFSLENWRDFIDENLRESWKVSSLS